MVEVGFDTSNLAILTKGGSEGSIICESCCIPSADILVASGQEYKYYGVKYAGTESWRGFLNVPKRPFCTPSRIAYCPDGGTIKRINMNNGEIIDTFVVKGGNCYACLVDSQGNLYVAHSYDGQGNCTKYDSAGNFLCRSNVAADRDGSEIAINDSETFVVVMGVGFMRDGLWSFSTTDLSTNWSKSLGGRSVAIDNNGNVYAASAAVRKKYNSNGTELWSKDVGSGAMVTDNSQLYMAAVSHAKAINLSDGSEIWSQPHGNTLDDMTIDSNGNVYFIQRNGWIDKMDKSDGTAIWTLDLGYTEPIGHLNAIAAI